MRLVSGAARRCLHLPGWRVFDATACASSAPLRGNAANSPRSRINSANRAHVMCPDVGQERRRRPSGPRRRRTDGPSALGADTDGELHGGSERSVAAKPRWLLRDNNAQGARRRIVAVRCRPGYLACTERPPRRWPVGHELEPRQVVGEDCAHGPDAPAPDVGWQSAPSGRVN
jgi:hypothetical protein